MAKKRIIFLVTWNSYTINISVSMNKALLEHSHVYFLNVFMATSLLKWQGCDPLRKSFAYFWLKLTFQYWLIWRSPPPPTGRCSGRCKILSLFCEIITAVNIVGIPLVELSSLKRNVDWTCNLETRGLPGAGIWRKPSIKRCRNLVYY